MKHTLFFTKKELFESWRTSRILILAVIFLIFGVMNPLVAKFTPEILKSVGGEAFLSGMPEPSSADSWAQFYKNISQMGLIILALLFSGSVSSEVSRGTLVNLVTKGLKRPAILLGKFISMVCQWTLCLALCFGVTWGYTLYYFSDEKSPHILLAMLPLWIYGLFLIALILLCSTIARNNYEGLLITGGVVVLTILLNMIDKIKEFIPASLISVNMEILQGSSEAGDYLPAMVIALVLGTLFMFFAVAVLNRKKL